MNEAEQSFMAALEISPQDQLIKTDYACFLFEQKKYTLALPQLQWAYQHAPENKQLREYLDICLQQEISNTGESSLYR